MLKILIFKLIYELKSLAANDKPKFAHKNRTSSVVKQKTQATNLMELLPNY